MKVKNKVLASSLLTIALAGGIVAGTTYALFTDNAKNDVAITSGKVDVSAALTLSKTYSAVYDAEGTLKDEYNNTYKHVEQEPGKFINTGTASVSDGNLILNKICPGDKVTAKLNITNNSNVTVKYQLKIQVTAPEGKTIEESKFFFSSLIFKIGDVDFSNIVDYSSGFAILDPAGNSFNISVEMPLTAGDEFQDGATNIRFWVEAVQGNAYVSEEPTMSRYTAAIKEVQSTEAGGVYSAKGVTYQYSDTKDAAEVTFPDAWATSTETDKFDSTLAVQLNDSEHIQDTFTVEDGAEAVGSLDLKLYVNGVQTPTFNDKVATVKRNIGANLTGVKVKYNDVDLKDDDNDDTDYSYDKTSGILTITTDHFSEYVVISDLPNWINVIDESVQYASKNIENKTISIATNEQLALLAKEAKAGTTYAGWKISLTADVDMGAYLFTPIQDLRAEFDGQNHTIKGLKVNSNSSYVGFVGALEGNGVVSNLVFDSANIKTTVSGGAYAAVVAGGLGSGATISNVTVKKSTISAPNGEYVSGITGASAGQISNVQVLNANITAAEQIGGVVGYLWCGDVDGCLVKDSSITAIADRAGGLFGKVQFAAQNIHTGTMTITNCEVSNSKINCASGNVGGFIGQIMGDCNRFVIDNIDIDATLSGSTQNPFANLRSSQNDEFVNALNDKVTNVGWTAATSAAESVNYTNGSVNATIHNANVDLGEN